MFSLVPSCLPSAGERFHLNGELYACVGRPPLLLIIRRRESGGWSAAVVGCRAGRCRLATSTVTIEHESVGFRIRPEIWSAGSITRGDYADRGDLPSVTIRCISDADPDTPPSGAPPRRQTGAAGRKIGNAGKIRKFAIYGFSPPLRWLNSSAPSPPGQACHGRLEIAPGSSLPNASTQLASAGTAAERLGVAR